MIIRCPKLRLFAATVVAIVATSAALAAEPPKETEKVDMAEMMARAKAYTQPGDHHQVLERFLGTWDTELKITMPGSKIPADRGTATFSWLMPGRWLKQETRGTLMGAPNETFMILGYDNFKQSFVTVSVGTMDTAMLSSEGDLDPSSEALITYGTVDEYLTGEHDKMVKYLWRFVSDDQMVLEVHDLPIGEHHTKVVEVTFNRQQG